MANFFGSFFKQMEKPQSVHPPSVPHEFSQYDSEYIKYCMLNRSWLFLTALIRLASLSCETPLATLDGSAL